MILYFVNYYRTSFIGEHNIWHIYTESMMFVDDAVLCGSNEVDMTDDMYRPNHEEERWKIGEWESV